MYNNLCSKTVTILYIIRYVFFFLTRVFILFKRNVAALGQNLLDLPHACPCYQMHFKTHTADMTTHNVKLLPDFHIIS